MTKKIPFLIQTTALFVFLTGSVWGQMVLQVDDATYFIGATGNVLTVNLENDAHVSALQLDMTFDPNCFTIDPRSLTYTDRSSYLNILQASIPEPGLMKVTAYGDGTHITPGSGPIAEFTIDVAAGCAEGVYEFALSNTKLADRTGSEYPHETENGSITIMSGTCHMELSATEFDMGNVWIGYDRKDILTIRNVGSYAGNVFITNDGCAKVELISFLFEIGVTRHITISCRPDKEGPCEGTLILEGCGDHVIPVICYGVIPSRSKGDVNGDGILDVLDVVQAVHIFLDLKTSIPSSEEFQAADCNGPTYNCNGDGVVDVLDIMKIVNLFLRLDECLSPNVIYFNSFESAEDTIDWSGISPEMFVTDPAPTCGRQSLYIGGGCTQPAAYIELPSQAEDSYYIVSCWGKANESDRGGKIVLTTADIGEEREETELIIHGTEWASYAPEESLYCSKDDTLRIELWIGGFVPAYMYVDCIKVEKGQ